MNSEDINDADLAAFLKGEDALSGELQAMQQASPSAELDAAILSRAEAQMARDTRPAAANDAGLKAPLSHLGLRWRVPAGIAATLMAGVLAHQAWQASADVERAAKVPAPTVTRETAPAPPAVVEADMPAPPPPAAPSHPTQRAPHRSSPPPAPQVVATPPVEVPVPQVAPPPPPPLSYSSAPAPAISSLTRAPSEDSRKVEVSGRRSRVEPGQAAAMAPGAPNPAAWLAAIDELLKAGLRRDTLEEWDKFRAAYPDYPVPAETTDKISALRK